MQVARRLLRTYSGRRDSSDIPIGGGRASRISWPDRQNPMSDIDILYATDLERLQSLLLSIDRPGSCCSHGRTYAPMPTVKVEGVGTLSFPVPVAQIRALLEASEPAP